jgi:hypothetical protein
MEFANLISKLIRDLRKLGQWFNLPFFIYARFQPPFLSACSGVAPTLAKADGDSKDD